MEEVQRLLSSAARDCVPEERNSFVSFQANTGVEVSVLFVLYFFIVSIYTKVFFRIWMFSTVQFRAQYTDLLELEFKIEASDYV